MLNLEDLEPRKDEFVGKTLNELVSLMKSLESSIFDSQCYGVNDVTLLLRIKRELSDRSYNWETLDNASHK
jgi:hypothetical protein